MFMVIERWGGRLALTAVVASVLLCGYRDGLVSTGYTQTLTDLASGGGRLADEPAWYIAILHYATLPFLLQGALLAVEISVLAMAGGIVLGLGLALMRLSLFAPVRMLAWTYIWFIRGTPQLLQLVFLYDALPGFGITLDTFTTAVLGFALNEAAFSAEIIRGGILSVNRNQTIAAASLGMGPFLTLRRIILPQAMRAILPGMANDAISMIKGTSIASVIFVNELTFRSQQIVSQNFQFFTVFAAAGLDLSGADERHLDAAGLPRASLQPGRRAQARRCIRGGAHVRLPPVADAAGLRDRQYRGRIGGRRDLGRVRTRTGQAGPSSAERAAMDHPTCGSALERGGCRSRASALACPPRRHADDLCRALCGVP